METLLKNSLCVALHQDNGIWAHVGIGCLRAIEHAHDAEWGIETLDGLSNFDGQWTYRIISYDLKDKLERIAPNLKNVHAMPMALTIFPSHVFKFRVDDDVEGFQILFGDFTELANACHLMIKKIRQAFDSETTAMQTIEESRLRPTITEVSYREALEKIKMHLLRGDIYEVNYCQEFKGNSRLLDPFEVWLQLLQNTSAPFAAYMQHGDWVLLCASPERFLQRKGQKLLSQPIKGTKKRSADPIEDDQLKSALRHSAKDRSENIMIVDLVRNDLARLAEKDTVFVKELCAVYSFKTVHHLISTIEATIPRETNLSAILQATFPMGSMTGAPKISAIQIAESLESFRRGWYSGSIGFVDPNGDFDFNVIIRSVIYNSKNHTLTCGVGGAITVASMAEAEYEESLLKANAIRMTI
jgi:para-aminobenzoate synthetase component I